MAKEKFPWDGEEDVDWAEKLKQVRALIDKEQKKFEEAQIPHPGAIWKMADDEFMHHVHLTALTRVMLEFTGMSNDEWMTRLNYEFLKQMKVILPNAIKMRDEARKAMIREQIVGGVGQVRPKI